MFILKKSRFGHHSMLKTATESHENSNFRRRSESTKAPGDVPDPQPLGSGRVVAELLPVGADQAGAPDRIFQQRGAWKYNKTDEII